MCLLFAGRQMIVLQGARERVERLYFTPRGNTLVVPARNRVQVWGDVTVSDSPVVLDGIEARSVQFTPDGTRMICDGRCVSIHNFTGGAEEVLRFAPPHADAAEAAVSPDGRCLI